MTQAPEISVVIPLYNEQENVRALLDELFGVLRPLGKRHEVIAVDDGSRDKTYAELQSYSAAEPALRVIKFRRNFGQTAAMSAGIDAARGEVIIPMDGDLQNDPADIPKLVDMCATSDAAIKLFAGWRIHRRDSASKRFGSRFANAIRRRLLHDDTPDTGCGIKLFERAAFLDLPYFDHMHRYLPALMQRAGWRVQSVPVNHRARGAGVSKYNNFNRALVGIADLRGVGWLISRSKRTPTEEV